MDTGIVYMKKNYTLNKEMVQWNLRQAIMGRPGFFSPDAMFVVHLILYRRRRQKPTRAMRCLWPFGGFAKGKPDVDNAVGTLMDAANKVLYGDDDQVVSCLIERRWAKEDGAFVRVLKLDDYDHDPDYDYEIGEAV